MPPLFRYFLNHKQKITQLTQTAKNELTQQKTMLNNVKHCPIFIYIFLQNAVNRPIE